MNPFIIIGYAGPEFFCDREKETNRIVNAMKNQRNLTLSSIRKMGKTGLIHHVLNKLNKSNEFDTIYLDIYDTTSLSGFINKFGNALLQIKETFSEKLTRKVTQFIHSIRPSITYDNLTGTPSLTFHIDKETDGKQTLEDLFQFLQTRSSDNNVIIAIDEFQQIANYADSNVEALLRTNIQSLQNVNFIFSGSNKHLLANMFTNVKRPFYQSTELLHLGEIPTENYNRFIEKKFKDKGVLIENDTIDRILKWTKRHTYYTQYLCNKIVSTEKKHIDNEALKLIFYNVLQENEDYYFEYRNLLTSQQWKLIIALAKEDGISEVTSSSFIRNYNLSNPSTIRRGLKALLGKELIYIKNMKYFVYDVFFSKWLERL